MRNAVGREIPDELLNGGREVFMGVNRLDGLEYTKSGPTVRASIAPCENKIVASISEAIGLCGLGDGMTVSFHHHLRDGDYILNMVMAQIAALGIRNITIAATCVGAAHDPLATMIEEGVVTSLLTSGIRGRAGEAVSQGKLNTPCILQSHGGRVRAVEMGELHIDVAFIAAPSSDEYGNCRGKGGKSDCGVLSYAVVDAKYADKVVVLTDALSPFPNFPASIEGVNVDYVVMVSEICDPAKHADQALYLPEDPRDLLIAEDCARVMEATPYFKEGFSLHVGADGPALAVNRFLEPLMTEWGIAMQWAIGGVSQLMVELLQKGLIRFIMDTQDFDMAAIRSVHTTPGHFEISASQYANPMNKGAFVNKLDFAILPALEIDTDFNVNMATGSDGVLSGELGGHPDAAAGAKCAIVATPLLRGRMPTVCERVLTVTVPGEAVDVLVTDHGIAVNPARPDLAAALKQAGLTVHAIEALKEKAYSIVGRPDPPEFGERIIAMMEARDGTILDVVRQVGG